MNDTHRKEYIAGLRGLADLLENNPDIHLPYDGRSADTRFHWIFSLPKVKEREQLRLIAKALPGRVDKEISDSAGQFYVKGQIRGLHVGTISKRDVVCKRVQTGTRTVRRPDPSAPPPPTVEVEESVYEWECDDGLLKV